MVATLVQGGTPKVRNQIAGYITAYFAAEETESPSEVVEEAE